jgi:hypothetical protein
MANPQPSTTASVPTGELLIDAITTGYKWTLGADRTIARRVRLFRFLIAAAIPTVISP